MSPILQENQPLQRPAPDSAVRRDHILGVAEKLFADRGFVATSARDIAREAEVNVATVYYHCGSKEQLVLSIYSRVIDRMTAFVGQAFAEVRDFDDVAAHLVGRVVEYFLSHPATPRLLLRSGLGDFPGLEERMRDVYQPLYELVAEQMKTRALDGGIRDFNPELFLSAATGVILNLCIDATKESAVSDSREVEAVAAHARAFILGALGLDPRAPLSG